MRIFCSFENDLGMPQVSIMTDIEQHGYHYSSPFVSSWCNQEKTGPGAAYFHQVFWKLCCFAPGLNLVLDHALLVHARYHFRPYCLQYSLPLQHLAHLDLQH